MLVNTVASFYSPVAGEISIKPFDGSLSTGLYPLSTRLYPLSTQLYPLFIRLHRYLVDCTRRTRSLTSYLRFPAATSANARPGGSLPLVPLSAKTCVFFCHPQLRRRQWPPRLRGNAKCTPCVQKIILLSLDFKHVPLYIYIYLFSCT